MNNPATNEVFDYDLHGIGEEPMALDHLIINGVARSTTKHDIALKNPYSDRPITYDVETDLAGASGPVSVTIPPGKKVTYSLSITPVLSGQYTGSITFTDLTTGEYFWWTALLNTESPPPNRRVDMVTTLRKAIAFDLTLHNPSKETATFEVFIEGEGLIGVPYLSIPPKSSAEYELFFLPLKLGKQLGERGRVFADWFNAGCVCCGIGSIAFVSDTIGEVWYELNLVAEDSQAVRLPMLKTELGKVDEHEVRLDNPSNEDVRVWVEVSNPANFEVLPESIIIPANEEISVNVRYMPSMLEVPQTSEVHFRTETIGNWDFLAFGLGIPPTQFEPKLITTGLNKDCSSVIHFKNPFKDSIQVQIMLEVEDESVKDVIQLLTKRQGKDEHLTIQGLGMTQIPFSFIPRDIRVYMCNIIVSMNDKIQWKYPIHASTESYSSGILQNFKTKCRVSTEDEFRVTLPGITDTFGESDTFTYEIKNVPSSLEAVISKSFQLRMVKNYLSSRSDSLQFVGRFLPMKPFKMNVDFIIHRKRGGLWKFKLQLESSEPNEDDLIVLSVPLGSVDSVSFKLTNRAKSFATFSARYTGESDPEFAVTPATGILEPYGRDGTNFTLSFAPVEYGKAKTAKLIIETEDMYWSYNLRGVLPKYDPPISGVSKIQNRLSEDVTMNWKHNKKNHLADNIKKIKESLLPVETQQPKGKKHLFTQAERTSLLETKSFNKTNNNWKNTSMSMTTQKFFKHS